MYKPEKKFYQLKELVTIVNLTYRQLLERIKIVYKEYDDRKDLINKKSNKWQIHFSLIEKFERIREPIDFKYFITIVPKNQIEIKYWKIVICDINKQLKKIDKTSRIKYVVEKTKNGIRHLHFMTSFSDYKKIRNLIKENDLINTSNEMNSKVQNIYKVKELHSYFRKQNKPVLLR